MFWYFPHLTIHWLYKICLQFCNSFILIYVSESVCVVYVFLCQCMDGSLSCCLFAVVVVVYWWWQRHSSALHQLRALRSFTFSFLFTFHFSFVLIFKKKRQQQKLKSTKNIIKDSGCDYHDDDERDSTDSHTDDDQQQQREKLAANKAKRAGGQTIRQAGKPETKQVTTPFALSYSGSKYHISSSGIST